MILYVLSKRILKFNQIISNFIQPILSSLAFVNKSLAILIKTLAIFTERTQLQIIIVPVSSLSVSKRSKKKWLLEQYLKRYQWLNLETWSKNPVFIYVCLPHSKVTAYFSRSSFPSLQVDTYHEETGLKRCILSWS